MRHSIDVITKAGDKLEVVELLDIMKEISYRE